MTLIAAIYDGKTTITVSDLLMSIPRLPGPGNAAEVPGMLYGPVPQNTHVAGLNRKTFRVGPNALFLWSGSKTAAANVTFWLNTLVHEGEQISQQLLERVFDETNTSRSALPCMIVYHDQHEAFVCHIGCFEYDLPKVGKVWVGGSGVGDFMTEFGRLEETFPSWIDANSQDYSFVRKVVYVDTILSAWALATKEMTIDNGWGGGLEVFTFTGLAFDPVASSILSHFVIIEDDNKEPTHIALTYLCTKRYIGSAICLLEIIPPTGEVRVSRAVPPHLEGIADQFDVDPSMLLPTDPHYNAAYLTCLRPGMQPRYEMLPADMFNRMVRVEEISPLKVDLSDDMARIISNIDLQNPDRRRRNDTA